ncbi:prepilin peptidase [Desulfofundulus thermobenzoicus]|uniref:Prepilin peptidase n=1 Tax=Desulfofundulus thermobenzoicus TaxID=29376 RepID=A0A6N7IWV3_9FIRM|nr:A24 family peptidase [Desulfofundulus thermobenzoicus]MQL53967.1 prepilin peptidase [Desulfofundulus thermobenzoicus]
MGAAVTSVIFLFGLFIGSFLNVVIHRVPRGESVVFPGSHCPACGHKLAPVELVPVFSYIWLKGRCQQCGAKISLRYPLVELLTGLLFVSLFLRFGISLTLLKYMVLACILVVVTFTDLEHMLIPDRIVVFAIVAGVVLDLILKANPVPVLLGAIIPAAFLYFLAVITKGGVGGGDIKLAFAAGLFLGWSNVLALMTAFFLGGLAGIALLISGKKGRKDAMVFGPFLATGMLAAAVWGQAVINWYLNFFA